MKKLIVLLLLVAGAYFGLKKWSPQTLERIAFWKSSGPEAPPIPALPPAEPAPTPVASKAPAPAVAGKEPVAGSAPAPAGNAADAAKPAVHIDKTSQVIVLLYHRLEGNAGGIYSITPELFEEHLQKLKDNGIEVISMADFLAWRRGEKSIPKKSALITLDDGYVSAYDVARPILKKFGYPWTYFVYTKFVGTGGKSVSWEQLQALREEGVEIGSHTVSHVDLRDAKGKTPEAYDQWLKDEIIGSKQIIERHTGGKCVVFAYPVGGFNTRARDLVKEAGYEAAFTAYGQRVTHGASMEKIGRYSWSAKRPQDMKQAFDFTGPIEATVEPPMAEGAAAPQ